MPAATQLCHQVNYKCCYWPVNLWYKMAYYCKILQLFPSSPLINLYAGYNNEFGYHFLKYNIIQLEPCITKVKTKFKPWNKQPVTVAVPYKFDTIWFMSGTKWLVQDTVSGTPKIFKGWNVHLSVGIIQVKAGLSL